MTAITHLVVNGCSWTYGQGLENPASQAWPALVAKELGIPVVNLAVRGSGNDGIHRRTYEYIYDNLSTNSSPLVIVAWSQLWRREGWYEEYDGHKLQDYKVIQHPTGKYPDHNSNPNYIDLYQPLIIPHWNEEDFLRKTLIYKLSLQNLFNSLSIPYLMADYSHDMLSDEYLKLTKTSKCKSFYESAYNKFHIDSLPGKIKQFNPLPCLHDGPEAQQVLADYILSEIKKLHPNISIRKDSTYLSIDNFVIEKNKQTNDWKVAAKNKK